MDRIRAAISRARDENVKTAPTAKTRPGAKPASQPASDDFQSVACDFDAFAKNRIISNEQDPVLNAYRVLRTRVLQKMEAENWRTVAVVSPGPGAGKTVTAINLAISLSTKENSRTMLVDLDFYRPSVARYLGISGFPSSLDFFEDKASLRDVTVRPDLADILLIANERVSRRGAEHLTSDRIDELIATSTGAFGAQRVIFDMSPILGCDDTLAFLPKIDCVLLVAASGLTRIAELREAKRILGATDIVGTVLNKSPSALVSNPYY